MATGSQVGSYIFGGLFVGVWLYIALFGLVDYNGLSTSAWSFWGFVGLLLAGAIYGSRIAEGSVRIALFITIGVALAMVLMGLLTREVEEGWATLLTFVGAGLIVSALPRAEPAAAK